MNKKKEEHDILDKTHIFDLWRTDITNMLEVLDRIEEKEEEDRLAQGQVNQQGKKKRAKPVKTAHQNAKAQKAEGKKVEPVKVPKP